MQGYKTVFLETRKNTCLRIYPPALLSIQAGHGLSWEFISKPYLCAL